MEKEKEVEPLAFAAGAKVRPPSSVRVSVCPRTTGVIRSARRTEPSVGSGRVLMEAVRVWDCSSLPPPGP